MRIIYGTPADQPRWRERIGEEGGTGRVLLMTYGRRHFQFTIRLFGRYWRISR